MSGGRDDEDFPDAREHQNRERVIDHRLVVNRQQLLAHCFCHGMQPGSCTTCQDYSFHTSVQFTPIIGLTFQAAPGGRTHPEPTAPTTRLPGTTPPSCAIRSRMFARAPSLTHGESSKGR